MHHRAFTMGQEIGGMGLEQDSWKYAFHAQNRCGRSSLLLDPLMPVAFLTSCMLLTSAPTFVSLAQRNHRDARRSTRYVCVFISTPCH